MGKLGKWIGAGLGWALGGPIGALIGLFIGSMFDTVEVVNVSGGMPPRPNATGRGDFMVSLSVLATAVMKADGNVTRVELDFVRQFFQRNFGMQGAEEAMQIVERLNNTQIPLHEVCGQIRYNMDHAAVMQLLYFLFGVAKADGNVCANEIKVLEEISRLLGIHPSTFNSIKSMYYDDSDSAYKILGVTSSATNEELKKAYRRVAMENHPDKVAHLGEEVRKAAEEKFTAINVAYEKIKKQRGMA
ncbi:MAG: TerB family tellurite resistance protein [Marinifilaceae bacterium]